MTVARPGLLSLLVDRALRPKLREHIESLQENDDVHG
jgi:hypothetical protein